MQLADLNSPEARWLADAVLPFLLPFVLYLTALKLWQLFVRSSKDPSCSLPLPPGSFGLPFLGESISLATQGYDFFRNKRAKYGRIYVTHLMGRPVVRVFGKENISKVLAADDSCITMSWPRSVQRLMGEGALAQSVGAVHSQRRTAILEALSATHVQAYVPVAQKVARGHINKWQQAGVMHCYTDSRRLALDLTARTLFGLELSDAQLDSILSDLCIVQQNVFSLPYDVPGFGLSKGMAARRSILRQLDGALHKAISQQSCDSSNLNAISVLLRSTEAHKLTLQEVKDSCVEILFGSIEGISSALCTILIKLACNKVYHEKASREVSSVLSGHTYPEPVAAPTCVRNIVNEALRLVPPVGGGYRKVLKTFELDGYQIPRGWTVLYSIRDQHECDPTVSNSGAFEPDRWSEVAPESIGSAPQACSFIPFGGDGSPRSCIGQHFALVCLKAVTFELLAGSRWSLSGGLPSFSYFPTPYPAAGTCLKFSGK